MAEHDMSCDIMRNEMNGNRYHIRIIYIILTRLFGLLKDLLFACKFQPEQNISAAGFDLFASPCFHCTYLCPSPDTDVASNYSPLSEVGRASSM